VARGVEAFGEEETEYTANQYQNRWHSDLVCIKLLQVPTKPKL